MKTDVETLLRIFRSGECLSKEIDIFYVRFLDIFVNLSIRFKEKKYPKSIAME
jgi:hypothetical protein